LLDRLAGSVLTGGVPCVKSGCAEV